MAKTEAKKKGSEDVWKKAKRGSDLTVPSGQTCRVKKVDLQIFLKTGRVPNSLRKIIDQAMSGKEFKDEELLENLMNGGDPAVLNDMIKLVDTVCLDVVLEPKLHPVPYPDEPELDEDGDPIPVPFDERDEDTIYVDEIDLGDRMFIFSFAVGGTADLEKFREQSESNVGTVLALTGAEGSTE